MEYTVTIGRYNDLCPFYECRDINPYVIIRYSGLKPIKVDYLDLENKDYFILKKYFKIAKNAGYQSKVINNLIIDTFTKVSIKLAINLIKTINNK
jgi:hypothetical protein